MNVNAIILHGACASGKTSLAKALQQKLDEPYLHLKSDYFASTLPAKDLTPPAWSPNGLGIKIIREFYQFCAHLVTQNHKAIVDHMAIGTHYAELFINPLKEQKYRILSVRVFCPLEECERRETESPNKEIGLSRRHYEEVYQAPYDIEVNTFKSIPDDCANQIFNFLKNDYPISNINSI